jgi:hypothetical protein
MTRTRFPLSSATTHTPIAHPRRSGGCSLLEPVRSPLTLPYWESAELAHYQRSYCHLAGVGAVSDSNRKIS